MAPRPLPTCRPSAAACWVISSPSTLPPPSTPAPPGALPDCARRTAFAPRLRAAAPPPADLRPPSLPQPAPSHPWRRHYDFASPFLACPQRHAAGLVRYGSPGDGGKLLCDLAALAAPCTVYSLGSNGGRLAGTRAACGRAVAWDAETSFCRLPHGLRQAAARPTPPPAPPAPLRHQATSRSSGMCWRARPATSTPLTAPSTVRGVPPPPPTARMLGLPRCPPAGGFPLAQASRPASRRPAPAPSRARPRRQQRDARAPHIPQNLHRARAPKPRPRGARRGGGRLPAVVGGRAGAGA
jgi:hypothetical protein